MFKLMANSFKARQVADLGGRAAQPAPVGGKAPP
jgi:hypothetical protein